MNGMPSSCPLLSSVLSISALVRTSTQSPTISLDDFAFILGLNLQTNLYALASLYRRCLGKFQGRTVTRRPESPSKTRLNQVCRRRSSEFRRVPHSTAFVFLVE